MIFAYLAIALTCSGPAPEWHTERTEHFELVYHERVRDLADLIRPRLEPELSRICRFIGTTPPPEIRLVIAPDPRSFSELQGGGVPRWVAGMAYPGRSLIVVRPLLGSEVRHSVFESVVSHEISHLALHRRLRGQTPPTWLDEGLAVYMGREPLLARSERLLPIAVTGRAIPFSSLEYGFPPNRDQSAAAYAQSGDFVKFLISTRGEKAFRDLLDLLAAGEPTELAVALAYQAGLGELEREWLKSVRRTYGLFAVLTGGGFLWFFISLLFLAAYIKKRRELVEMRRARAFEEPNWPDHHGFDDDYYDDDDLDEDLDEDGLPPEGWRH